MVSIKCTCSNLYVQKTKRFATLMYKAGKSTQAASSSWVTALGEFSDNNSNKPQTNVCIQNQRAICTHIVGCCTAPLGCPHSIRLYTDPSLYVHLCIDCCMDSCKASTINYLYRASLSSPNPWSLSTRVRLAHPVGMNPGSAVVVLYKKNSPMHAKETPSQAHNASPALMGPKVGPSVT